ncbi:hypothetical protein GCM10020000_23870 [Streptomyces olivoverticillatus]
MALDGFGSGYAAMAALRRLPIDVLKLDRELVDGVTDSARLHKITAGLLRIACDLGMQSVADGVDEPEQARVLRAMGCTHGQGGRLRRGPRRAPDATRPRPFPLRPALRTAHPPG